MKNKYLRLFWVSLGILFTALGIIGILLPLLPTTPFLLLAATCFSKGSQRFYHLLLNNPVCGKYIKAYKAGNGIPLHGKLIAILALWIGMAYSIIFVVPVYIGKIVLLCIASGVTFHISTIKSKKVKS